MDNIEEINFLRQKVQALQTENDELKLSTPTEAEQYKAVIVNMNRVLNAYGSSISDLFGHDEDFLKVRDEIRRISGDPQYVQSETEN